MLPIISERTRIYRQQLAGCLASWLPGYGAMSAAACCCIVTANHTTWLVKTLFDDRLLGGATWSEQWTLWERQPEIPDSPCSDALVYSNKTGAMYFGHPGEWLDPKTGPVEAHGARSNYTILRSLDEGKKTRDCSTFHMHMIVFIKTALGKTYRQIPQNTHFCAILYLKMHHFTKTGSGQT